MFAIKVDPFLGLSVLRTARIPDGIHPRGIEEQPKRKQIQHRRPHRTRGRPRPGRGEGNTRGQKIKPRGSKTRVENVTAW